MACTVMACIVGAYIVMACIVMTYIPMVYRVMAYIVMAFIIAATKFGTYDITALGGLLIPRAAYGFGLCSCGLRGYGLYS